ncbi:MAG: hypothetical protein DRO16_01860 [Thermoprotei archaeon]|nr:MAG: hypothetical protein DRO16_01860 [Thermoprotei archaeon]
MDMGETSNVALLKDIIKKYVKSIYNVLYYNKNISTATYEKLALSIDSLKMLMISMEWHNTRYDIIHGSALYKEFNENLISIIQQLKTMIIDFERGRINDKEIKKLNEYIDITAKNIQIINNKYIKEMIKIIK